jgi:peptide/nickel transport system substrate-binding protein
VSERLSGTVTFLFTDVEGSTALLKRLGRDAYGELLGRWKALLREAFGAHGGDEVDNQGDQFFVAFRSARDALLAAVAIQRSLADHEWSGGAEVLVRIGIHSGEAAAAAERYVGISVHRAARIGAVAHGGQALVSDSTRTLVEDELPDGIFLRDLGLWRLKDIDRPERLWQVAAEGLRTEFPPLLGAERVKPPAARRRSLLAAALVGLIAAAVAIPVFAFGGAGGSVSSVSVDANSVSVIDASSGRLVGSSAVGAAPEAIGLGDSAVWATNPETDSVSRIDPKTNTRAGTVGVGNSPTGVAVGGGFVWVTNGLDGTVSKIDPEANGGTGGQVDRIQVGNGPSGVAIGDGRVWVTNSIDRTVSVFAPGSRKPRTIRAPRGADAVAYGDGFVWVVSNTGNSVTRIVPQTGTLLPPISVGNGPSAIAVNAGAVWVANSLDGTVSRIDPSTGAAGTIPVGGDPTGIAAANGVVWVGDTRASTLSRIDPALDKVVQILHTSNPPAALAVNGGQLYVAVGTPALAHRGGTLTVFTSAPFDSIDPATAGAAGTPLIMTNDGLVAFQRIGGANGIRIVPDLATSPPLVSDGGLTYTFQVLHGIHYSTGSLVQPADFRRALERSVANTAGQDWDLTGIVGANACVKTPTRCDLRKGIAINSTARTVTFHLTAPDPDFLEKLALPPAFAVPANTPFKAQLPLPATGPYKIARNDNRGATLVRNPRFHEWSAAAQPDGYPDSITLRFGGSSSAQVNAVTQGRADYTTLTTAVAATLRRSGYSSQAHVNPNYFLFYFFLNTRLAPFNNPDARRAVNYAIDRNRLVPLTSAGQGQPIQETCQVLPPGFLGHVRFCLHEHDLAKARQLVAASGTTGETVTVWTGPPGLPMSSYLVSVLKGLGYKTSLNKFASGGEYLAALAPGKAQAGPLAWAPAFPAPSDFFAPLLSCAAIPPHGLNIAAFCDRTIDRQIKRARALENSDPGAAAVLWSKIDQGVMRQAPWAPFGNGAQPDLISRRVRNYQYNPQWGPLFDQMWVR